MISDSEMSLFPWIPGEGSFTGVEQVSIRTALCAQAVTAQEELGTEKIKATWASVVSDMQCKVPADIQQDLVVSH